MSLSLLGSAALVLGPVLWKYPERERLALHGTGTAWRAGRTAGWERRRRSVTRQRQPANRNPPGRIPGGRRLPQSPAAACCSRGRSGGSGGEPGMVVGQPVAQPEACVGEVAGQFLLADLVAGPGMRPDAPANLVLDLDVHARWLPAGRPD